MILFVNLQLLLPHGAPASLRPLVDILVDNFSSVTMTTQQLLKGITKIVELYRSGSYMKRAPRKQISGMFVFTTSLTAQVSHDFIIYEVMVIG